MDPTTIRQLLETTARHFGLDVHRRAAAGRGGADAGSGLATRAAGGGARAAGWPQPCAAAG